ncbi:unnamed protein product [marine sediment metagenome]|uniref:Uncharacterized protein n=1 Tax=marine sediment metagenome TaxID=412755 RepID=X1E294_9ZZZZ
MKKLIKKLQEFNTLEYFKDREYVLSKWFRDILYEHIIEQIKSYKDRELKKHGL